MIPDYLDRLARELDFDRSLSRRVRQEVEDHLWEAVAADSTGDMLQAQQRAIARFGDARVIAAQFAVVCLANYTRRAGVAAVLVIAAVFMAMKARIAWYAAMQWAISDDMKAVSGLVVQIDRYASGCRLSSDSAVGPTSAAAGFRPRSIRHIAGSFAASFCCVPQRRRRLSFRSSAMGCSRHCSCWERNCLRNLWSRSSRWRSRSHVPGFSFFTYAASRCGRHPRRPC
jgi:hypothetical protein